MKIRPRASSVLRCAVCHEDGGAELDACACGSRTHAECRAGDRCPTLGCENARARNGLNRALIFGPAREPLAPGEVRWSTAAGHVYEDGLPTALEAALARLSEGERAAALREGRTHVAANGVLVHPPTPDVESELARIVREMDHVRQQREEWVRLDAESERRMVALERDTRREIIRTVAVSTIFTAAWFAIRWLLRMV